MSNKDERIAKWFKQGCSIRRIAAKLGNPQNLQRVVEGLLRERCLTLEQMKCECGGYLNDWHSHASDCPIVKQ